MTEQEEKKLEIEFPCYFPLKAIGDDIETYRQFVVDTVAKYCNTIMDDKISTRLSNGGKYIAVTVPFTAENRKQLDNIYQALSDDKRTKYLI